ncbi:MAG: hypothetical protein M3R60_11080 [Pseudomonadota bacterium]|nr:hypothetical protein [Pseudomonadota bacterium]
MRNNHIIKALLGVSAAAVLLGAFSASAQKAPPVTGEANDHTSPGAVMQPAPKAKNATGNINPGVVPPQVGEANDQTSPNAASRPAPKAKPMKHRMKRTKAKVKPPVTGEANDHSSNGGSTEAAKAVKAASM